jgi:hypothetical protein
VDKARRDVVCVAWQDVVNKSFYYEIQQMLPRSVNIYLGLKLKKLRGLSPQANYTDRATSAVGEVVPTFADRGVLRGRRNGSPRPLISVF